MIPEKIKNKISIIIPVFNGADFIEAAYKNILGQGIEHFEIIFVDNNSTDNSVKVIENLKNEDSRILFFKEKKQGAAAARNKAIQHISGEYVHFFDVDDLLFDYAYKELKKVLVENRNILSVFGKLIRSSKKAFDLSPIESDTNTIKVHENDGFELDWLKDKTKLVGPPAFLHRREVFEKINGFQENLLIGEDGFFHVRLANECCIASLDKTIYHYYRHVNSTVSIVNKKHNERVFSYWNQVVNAYLPYANSDKVSFKFKKIVFKQVYSSIGKQLVLTDGYKARRTLFNKLREDITPLKISVAFRLYYKLLVLSGNRFLYKFFVYYVLNFYLNYFIKPKRRNL